MYDGLPDACLTLKPSDGSLIFIERGQSGYHTSNWDTGNPRQNREIADFYNKQREITTAQEKAMLNGSLFGWDIPAADPRHYENLPPPEVNEGYTIIKRETVGKIEIVFGESFTAPAMYVTWRRTPSHEQHGHPEYYWGHYFNSKARAETDFNSRVEAETMQLREETEERFKTPPKRHEPER